MEKAINYVMTKSPSTEPVVISLLESSHSPEQNCLKPVDTHDSNSVDKHDSDQENMDQISEVAINGSESSEDGVRIRKCAVQLTRLCPKDLPRAHSNRHQSRTTSPYQSSSKSSSNHLIGSDSESCSSKKSGVIVKRLAADDCSLSEKIHRKKGKFRGVPAILRDKQTLLETNLPTVAEASNCDTLNRCTKRQREELPEISHLSLINVNDSELETAPTCLLASSSLCSTKKMRISPRNLPDVAGSEPSSVPLLQSSSTVQYTSADEPDGALESSESPGPVVVELAATSSNGEKKRCSARRNIFDTPRWSETLDAALQSENCDLPDLSGDLPDLSGDEKYLLSLDVLQQESSIGDQSTEGDLYRGLPRCSATFVADYFNEFDNLLTTKLKQGDLQSTSPVIPVLDPINCCSTVVFNLVSMESLLILAYKFVALEFNLKFFERVESQLDDHGMNPSKL